MSNIKPKHYQFHIKRLKETVEVIEITDSFFDKAQNIISPKQGAYWFSVVSYLFRYPFKNGKEDLLKAKYYLDRLIEDTNESNPGS